MASTAPVAPAGADPIRDVLIVGGGSAGWMAATLLSRALGRATKVRLVESAAIGIVGVGEATIPPIRQFNQFCGIDERAFLRETDATFKLGVQFENWGPPGSRYLHAFGPAGQELDAVVRLHHWWRLGLQAGLPSYPEYQDLFLARAAADGQRYGLDPRAQPDLARLLPHAYHFDAIAYGQHLRGVAEARGVERVEGTVTGVERDLASGHVAAVMLEDGRRLQADLFIDCSGFRSLLLGQELGEPFDDWSRWLPADRALAVPSKPKSDQIAPITRAIAHTVGWQWRIPLQSRVGNGHVYSSAFSGESDAEQRLLAALEGEPLDTPRLLRFATGRRKRPWVGNVVAVGLAAGFLEPLESTSIHLVQSALERLVELFPSRRMDPLLRDRFNAQSEREWEQVRDFIITHYKLCGRDDSEFWRYLTAMDVPDSLAGLLELWEQHGVLDIDGGHLFQTGSWASILIGHDLVPRTAHPLTARVAAADIAPRVKHIADVMRQRAAGLPDHAAFVRQRCGDAQP